MSIPDEMKINRQGTTFVLFSGLLNEAHERGLRGIFTELIQVPEEANGNVAICKARVEMEDGRRFEGLGDASPENVGRNIQPHLLRMAETRAKARALRDAVNVGITALEELGGDEPTRTTNQPRSGAQKPVQGTGGGSDKATEKQVWKLQQVIRDSGHSIEVFEGKHGPIANLSKGEASGWIERLSGGDSNE